MNDFFKKVITPLKDDRVLSFTSNKIFFYAAQIFGTSYTAAFMTGNLGISASTVAMFVTLANGIGFFLSFFTGILLQSVNPSGGKKDGLYSWLSIAKWFFSLSTIIMFLNTNELGVIGAYITCISYVIHTAANRFLMGINDVMMGAMARTDLELRSSMGIWGVRGSKLATLIVDVLTPPLVVYFTTSFGVQWAFAPIGIFYGIFSFISQTFYGKSYKKHFIHNQNEKLLNNSPQIGMVETFKNMALDKKLLVMLISLALFGAATACIGYGMVYFWRISGRFGLDFSLSNSIVSISSLLLVTVAPILGKRLGRKNALTFGLTLIGVSSLILFFFARYSVWVNTFTNVLNQVAVLTMGAFYVPVLIDEAERYLYETGKDLRSVTPTLLGFATGLGALVGGMIFNFGLAYIGFDNIDLENITGTVTPEFLNNFFLIWAGPAAILGLLSGVIWFFGYRITDEQAEFYATENAKRVSE